MSDAPAEHVDPLKRPEALDRLCDAIIDGRMLTEIALEWGVTRFRLMRWIAAEPTRGARVKEARRLSAQTYDEKAEQAIKDATDDLGLKKAKELAHHYRWKASKINPGDYGDKIEVGGPGDFSKSADDDLVNRLDALMPGAGAVARAALEGSHPVH